MRTTAIRLASLILAVGLPGCVDLEEHPVTGVTGAYFATPEGANAAITGAYGVLRWWLGQGFEHPLFFAGTDSWQKGDQAFADGTNIFNDYTSALAPDMPSALLPAQFGYLYFSINAANTAVHYISPSTQLEDSTKARLLGEARFLRALSYFYLVRMWGPVSLSLEPTEAATITAHRTSTDSIYDVAIIPDLEYAIDYLPARQAQYGHATRGAAQTLLTEVYLTRGRPGDPDRARALATAVIESGTYSLAPVYRRLFCGDKYPEACEFVAANEHDSEFIFSVQFTGDGVADTTGNKLHMMWLMAYEREGAAVPRLTRGMQYGRAWRRLMPTPHLLNLWNRATDSRYEATFQTLWKRDNGDTAIYFPGTDTVATAYQSRPYRTYGQKQYDPFLFPSLRKWLDDKRKSFNDQVGGRDRHLWRLADVYLLRAEASIRAGRIDEARADFDVLRRRAAIPDSVNTLSAAEIARLEADPIDFLLDERERELAGEEQRWFVLTRVDRLVQRVRAYNTAAAANIQPYHALRPIPQVQIDRTKGGAAAFPQNPGY